MSTPEDFHSLTASEGLQFVRHNATDFSAYKEFQEKLDSRFSQSEKLKAAKARKSNLAKWVAMLPPRWATATLKSIEKPAAREVEQLLDSHRKTSLYIHGDSGAGKTYLAYAALRRFIGHGWTTPSKIKVVSEEYLMGLAQAGFEGRSQLSGLFKAQYDVYLFDNVGNQAAYGSREKQIWEQLIEHIYSNSLTVIFTSNRSLENFSVHLSDSAESKLSFLLDGKIIEMARPRTSRSATGESASNRKEKDLYDSFPD